MKTSALSKLPFIRYAYLLLLKKNGYSKRQGNNHKEGKEKCRVFLKMSYKVISFQNHMCYVFKTSKRHWSSLLMESGNAFLIPDQQVQSLSPLQPHMLLSLHN